MALVTCSKCGRQFYGTGCPDCDFPPVPANPGQQKRDRLWGVLMMGTGLGLAVVVLACPQEDLPSWPGFIAGVIFFVAGLATATSVRGRLGFTLGGLICAGMASLGFFAAFAPGKVEGDNIPFLPEAWNQVLGKIAFGVGACFTAAFALWWFYRGATERKRE
jgi:hypothetical protein